MKHALLAVILCGTCAAQDKPSTWVNFGLRAADTAQTCYLLKTVPNWHEYLLPTQSCAGLAAFNAGFAFGSLWGDRWLTRHHMKRFAHLQIVSAGGSAVGIAYTSARIP